MCKKLTEADGNGDYPEELIKIMDETKNCLNCGKPLKYLSQAGRRNRGYCNKACLVAKTPKMVYIEKTYKKPVKQAILDLLNQNSNVTVTANLLGIEKESLYLYMKKLKIQRKVLFVG